MMIATRYRCENCGETWREPGEPDPTSERTCLCIGGPISAERYLRWEIIAALVACIATVVAIVAALN